MLLLPGTLLADPLREINTTTAPAAPPVIDYQHPNSALAFTRSALSTNTGTAAQTTLWRHRYEIVLTNDNGNRVLFDELGQRHVFTRNTDGTYEATNSSSGTLTATASGHDWINNEGTRFNFAGSHPERITHPDGQSLDLLYKQGRLDSVSDGDGNRITFNYPPGQSTSVSLPDGRSVSLENAPCNSDGTPIGQNPQQCDTKANPVPGFNSIQTSDWTHKLDARPASCKSYFVEYYGTERGAQIESGLQSLPPYSNMIPTVRNFPIVDFINGHELVVVRSRDLASPGFNSVADPGALLNRLLRDGREIQSNFLDPLREHGSITSTELGTNTRIDYDSNQQITLQVIIRQGMASLDHWRQIELARTELQNLHSIKLEVVTVP